MKKISKILWLGAVMIAALSTVSCVPGYSDESGSSDPNAPTLKPDPEGANLIGLYCDTGDNLGGIGFHRDGYITSVTGADWFFSSLGEVPGLGNVDYIPASDWNREVFPRTGMGIVAYSPTQGFVQMIVAGFAKNDQGQNVGVALKYKGGFHGWDEPLEISVEKCAFDGEGGSKVIAITGKKYATYSLSVSKDCDSWLRVRPAYGNYSFIYNKIEVEAHPNTIDAERRATVTLRTTAGKESTFEVVQSPA